METKKHTLKVVKWERGILESLILMFDSLEEAIEACMSHKGHRKIYNENFELVYSQQDIDNGETYA